MNRMKLARVLVVSGVAMILVAIVLGTALSAAFGASGDEPADKAPGGAPTGPAALAIAACIASGTLGAGYAVGKVGSAAIGAASDRPEIMGRALVFVVIAEGIAVWGLVGAILLL